MRRGLFGKHDWKSASRAKTCSRDTNLKSKFPWLLIGIITSRFLRDCYLEIILIFSCRYCKKNLFWNLEKNPKIFFLVSCILESQMLKNFMTLWRWIDILISTKPLSKHAACCCWFIVAHLCYTIFPYNCIWHIQLLLRGEILVYDSLVYIKTFFYSFII